MEVVQTVLGNVELYHLGRTLTHEHLCMDFENFYCTPPCAFDDFLKSKICLENIGYIRQYPYSSRDNLRLNDETAHKAVMTDLELFKKFGGGSIVENSSYGLKRNMSYMVEASKKTNIHIIAGTGHYVADMQTADHCKLTLEQMIDLYSKEIITGIKFDGVGTIKCGFIGEVGSVYPLKEFEKRAIKATGEAQQALGCGVSFHPGRDPKAPFEIMRLYLEAGGNANKCVISHMDRTIFDIDQLLEFSNFGCYIQYDLFGTECSLYQLNTRVDMPSDGQRINTIMKLIEEGLLDKILLSHDVHTKHRLTSFGGHGFHHLYLNVLPRMHARGLTLKQMDQITVINPANWLKVNV